MKYIALVYHEEAKLKDVSEVDLAALMSECRVWLEELETSGEHHYSAALQAPSTAMTLRNRNGRLTTTDGPFAETKEFLGGFTIFEARDLNEAFKIVGKSPATRFGSVELRPVFDSSSDLIDPIDQKIAAAARHAGHIGMTSQS